MKRARCPICKRTIALHPKGTLYRHRDGRVDLCPASGFTPQTVIEVSIRALEFVLRQKKEESSDDTRGR